MYTRHRRHHRPQFSLVPPLLHELWQGFWLPPQLNCPRCNNAMVEYYDPFFFSILRTLKGTRRLKCRSCSFVWRPNRKRKVVWENFFHRY